MAVAFSRPPDYTRRTVSAHRLAVRTPPSHGGNRGSIPLGRTSLFQHRAAIRGKPISCVPDTSGEIGARLPSDETVRNSAAGGNHAGVLRSSGHRRVYPDFGRLYRTRQAGTRAAQDSQPVQTPASRLASIAAGPRANRRTISAQAAGAAAGSPLQAGAGKSSRAAAPRNDAAAAGSQQQAGNRTVKAAGLPERLAGGWPHSRRV